MIDTLLDFLKNPDNTIPIVIGAVISWWLAHRYSFAPKTPKLRDARKHRRTDFGGNSTHLDASAVETIESPVGRFRINGDGTVSDLSRGLTWIQAPWGLAWNGKEFFGVPVRIDWWEATALFGRGAPIGIPSAGLSKEQLARHGGMRDYQRGRCVAEFAGHDDWRLPTAGELDTIGCYDPEGAEAGFAEAFAPDAKALRARLFPNLERLSYDLALWSANEQGPAIAWAMDRNATPGDYRKKEEKCVLLVRVSRVGG